MIEPFEPFDHHYFMKTALKLAQNAWDEGEIPVGAIVAAGNQIIGKGYNQTEVLKDSTAHAEMIALTSAFQYLGAKYLHNCRIYITLEPCVMCAGALHWAQIDEVIYGATDPKKGFTLFSGKKGKSILHPSTKVVAGIMNEECGAMVEKFFRKLRK